MTTDLPPKITNIISVTCSFSPTTNLSPIAPAHRKDQQARSAEPRSIIPYIIHMERRPENGFLLLSRVPFLASFVTDMCFHYPLTR